MSRLFVLNSFVELLCAFSLGLYFFVKGNWRKSCLLNIGEINYRAQSCLNFSSLKLNFSILLLLHKLDRLIANAFIP